MLLPPDAHGQFLPIPLQEEGEEEEKKTFEKTQTSFEVLQIHTVHNPQLVWTV